MAYSAIAVANAFIEKAKEKRISDLTPMKLQKLVYFAHAWSLAAGGEPLINDEVKAWKFGPVINSIYHEFKSYGSNNITKLGTEFVYEDDGEHLIRSRFVAPIVPKSDEMANVIIDTILEVYGDKSAYYLSNLTHEKGSAWEVTREQHQDGDNKGFVIPNDIIEQTTKSELGIE